MSHNLQAIGLLTETILPVAALPAAMRARLSREKMKESITVVLT